MSTLGLTDSVPAIVFLWIQPKNIIAHTAYDSDVNALTQRVINKRYGEKNDQALIHDLFSHKQMLCMFEHMSLQHKLS